MIGVGVHWDVPGKLLCFTFEGRWTEEEYYAAVVEACCMVANAGQPVRVILHFAEGAFMAHGNEFDSCRDKLSMMPGNVCGIAVVSHNRVSRTMYTAFVKFCQSAHPTPDIDAFVTDSLDEARHLLLGAKV